MTSVSSPSGANPVAHSPASPIHSSSSSTNIRDLPDELVRRANALLGHLNISVAPLESFEDLRSSASSMFVAFHSRTFGYSLEGVSGPPDIDHAANAQLVIDAVSNFLGVRLGITGRDIVMGSPRALGALLLAFEYVLRVDTLEVAAPTGRSFHHHTEMLQSDDEQEEEEEEESEERSSDSSSVTDDRAASTDEEEYEEGKEGEEHSTSSQDDESVKHDDEEADLLTSQDARRRQFIRDWIDAGGSLPTEEEEEDEELTEEEWHVQQRAEEEEEFALLDSMGKRFPNHWHEFRKHMKSLKAFARHRAEGAPGFSGELARERARDKLRFQRGYARLLEEDRREMRLAALRRQQQRKYEEQAEKHRAVVERHKTKRLAEELEREAKARRLRRLAQEEVLVRSMFEQAFEDERARIAAGRARMAEAALERDKEALRKYRAERDAMDERVRAALEAAKEDEARRKRLERQRRDALNDLSRKLRGDMEARMKMIREDLDRSEERILRVNTNALERAFGLLSESAHRLHETSRVALSIG